MNIKYGWKVFLLTLKNPLARQVFDRLDRWIDDAETSTPGRGMGSVKFIKVKQRIESFVRGFGVAYDFIKPLWPEIEKAIKRYVAKRNASGDFRHGAG